jgi:DNA-binding response OmpR family regulator
VVLPATTHDIEEASKESEVTASSENEDLPLLLVIEDNEDLRRYIRIQLEGKYRVSICTNGREGLEKAIEIIPDLIVSDLMMPEMDGYELCTRIKTDERTSHIPVILLTALATSEGRLTGLETGADDYLTKPFDTRELDVRIQNLITSRRKLREHFSNQLRQPVMFEIQPSQVEVVSADEKFLHRVTQVVEANMSNELFSVDDFSVEIGMSRMQLHRKLKSLTNHSASDFIRIMRLKRAAQLLEARAGNVTEISYLVGFNSLAYFSKCFHDYFGIQPKEYAAKDNSPVDAAS